MSLVLSINLPTPEQIKRYWTRYFPTIPHDEPAKYEDATAWIVDCPICGGVMVIHVERDVWVCAGHTEEDQSKFGNAARFERLKNGGSRADAITRTAAIMGMDPAEYWVSLKPKSEAAA